MQQQWEQTQLPQLERKSYKLWRQGQNSTQIQTWQGDAEHWRGQLAKLVHEVAVIHVGKARLPVRAIKKSSRSIQQMYVNLQEVVFKLKLRAVARASQAVSEAPCTCWVRCWLPWLCCCCYANLFASHAHLCSKRLFITIHLTEC